MQRRLERGRRSDGFILSHRVTLSLLREQEHTFSINHVSFCFVKNRRQRHMAFGIEFWASVHFSSWKARG
jgi:hypothetical protein